MQRTNKSPQILCLGLFISSNNIVIVRKKNEVIHLVSNGIHCEQRKDIKNV